MIPELLFWISLAALVHTYLFFPLLAGLLARGKRENTLTYRPEDDLPFISIILPVHNEDRVILEKLRSIYNTGYPLNKFEVFVGSDASTDGTNQICRIYSENYESLHFYPFKVRMGKPQINNFLVEKAKGSILVMTDAQAFFKPYTLFGLIKHFRNKETGIVGGNIINEKKGSEGISFQEKVFMTAEIRLKYREGLVWGRAMGVYGAAYAIRRDLFDRVPVNCTVDDFYITMKTILKGRKVIMNMNALIIEDVPDDLLTEFRRKVRISAGNFQNLRIFFKALLPPWSALSFIFLSHKVLRWTGPFLILIMYVSTLLLSGSSLFYRYLFILQTILFILPFIDYFLRKLHIHVIFLRFITHFYAMNFALFLGFIKNITGSNTSIWEPTRR